MAYGFVAILLLGCAIAGWRNRFARPASALAFGLLLGVVLSAFPDNANHQHLSLLLLILVLLADSRGSDDERNALAALQSMRWIAVIGVFWAGVMKLFCDYWLGGEFLAFRVAGNSGFTQVLGLLVSREEGSSCWVSEWILGPSPFAPMLRF
jgi:hypothetical protein